MEVASPGVGQRGHLINDDPQHLLLARGGVMVSAQVAIESPGVGTVCRDEGVDDLPFAGLDLESGPTFMTKWAATALRTAHSALASTGTMRSAS